MAFTSKDDINILQATDAATVGAGAGNDRYILDASVLRPGQSITISDAQGLNTLQLVGGLVIVGSLIENNALQLTLSNGATVAVLGAATFLFQTGGNGLTGSGGMTQTYADFAVQSLGAPRVPNVGEDPVAGGANRTVDPQGGTVDPDDGGEVDPGVDDPDGQIDPGAGGDPGTGGGGNNDAQLALTPGIDNLVGTAGNDLFDGVTNIVAGAPDLLVGGDFVIGGPGEDTLQLAQDIADKDLAGVAGIEHIETISQAITLGNNANLLGLQSLTNSSDKASVLTLAQSFIPNGAEFVLGTDTIDTLLLDNAPPLNLNVLLDAAKVGNGDASPNDEGELPVLVRDAGPGIAPYLAATDEGLLLGATNPDVFFFVNGSGPYSQLALGTSGDDTFDASAGTLSDLFGEVFAGFALFGGDGNDTLTGGGPFNNLLDGGSGDDTLVLNAGNTAMGSQVLRGGDDKDTLQVTETPVFASLLVSGFEFIELAEATILTLPMAALATNPLVSVAGTKGGVPEQLVLNGADTVGDMANLSALMVTDVTFTLNGLGGDDVLTGSKASDSLDGGVGNDTLTGGAGVDTVNGGLGNDLINVSAADDAGAGESLDGGDGNDTLRVTGNLVFDPSAVVKSFETVALAEAAGVTLSLAQFGANPNLTQVTGTAGGVTETLTVSAAATGSTINLATITQVTDAQLVALGQAGNDMLTGSAFADMLIGGAGTDTLTGGAGDDTLTGGAGVDTVNGGLGNDLINVSAADDAGAGESLDGGDGNDTLRVTGNLVFDPSAVVKSFETVALAEAAGVTLSLAQFGANPNLTQVTGTAGGVTETLTVSAAATGSTINLATITQVTNAQLVALGLAGNDTLTGSAFADMLIGGAGNDTLTGGGGVDNVNGGAGNDLIIVNGTDDAGAETLDGGIDIDTLQVTSSLVLDPAAAVQNFEVVNLDEAVNLSLTAAQFNANPQLGTLAGTADGVEETLRIQGVDAEETIDASGIAVTNARIVIDGGADDDIITASNAGDTIRGGEGFDNILLGDGADIVSVVGLGTEANSLSDDRDDVYNFGMTDVLRLTNTSGDPALDGMPVRFATVQEARDGVLADGITPVDGSFIIAGNNGDPANQLGPLNGGIQSQSPGGDFIDTDLSARFPDGIYVYDVIKGELYFSLTADFSDANYDAELTRVATIIGPVGPDDNFPEPVTADRNAPIELVATNFVFGEADAFSM